MNGQDANQRHLRTRAGIALPTLVASLLCGGAVLTLSLSGAAALVDGLPGSGLVGDLGGGLFGRGGDSSSVTAQGRPLDVPARSSLTPPGSVVRPARPASERSAGGLARAVSGDVEPSAANTAPPPAVLPVSVLPVSVANRRGAPVAPHVVPVVPVVSVDSAAPGSAPTVPTTPSTPRPVPPSAPQPTVPPSDQPPDQPSDQHSDHPSEGGGGVWTASVGEATPVTDEPSADPCHGGGHGHRGRHGGQGEQRAAEQDDEQGDEQDEAAPEE